MVDIAAISVYGVELWMLVELRQEKLCSWHRVRLAPTSVRFTRPSLSQLHLIQSLSFLLLTTLARPLGPQTKPSINALRKRSGLLVVSHDSDEPPHPALGPNVTGARQTRDYVRSPSASPGGALWGHCVLFCSSITVVLMSLITLSSQFLLHPVLSQNLKLLSTTLGREKTLRAIQSLARILSYVLLLRGSTLSAQRWSALQSHLVISRKRMSSVHLVL
jgi:hypothetical protein